MNMSEESTFPNNFLFKCFLIFILVIGFLLRLTGIGFGLPYPYQWDESQLTDTALKMMKTGDYNPHFFKYPTLYIYLQLIVYVIHYFYAMGTGIISSLDEIKTEADTHWPWTMSHPSFYLWGRLLTCLLGTITIFFVYKIAMTLINEKVALLSALFLALSPGHIEHSRYIGPDVPGTLFVLAAVLFASYIYKYGGSSTIYSLAGLFGGFAVATKYNNFWVIFPLIIAHAFNQRKEGFFKKNFFLMMFFLIFGFYLGCPYALWDLPGFLKGAGWEVRHYKLVDHPGAEGTDSGFFYFSSLYDYSLGIPLTIFCLSGLVIGFLKNLKAQLIILSFPVLYYFFMSMQRVRFIRNTMPLLPFACIFAAIALYYSLEYLAEKKSWISKYKQHILCGSMVILTIWPFVKSVSDAKELHYLKDSRTETAEWVKENIPEGSTIAVASQLHFYFNDLKVKKINILECDQGGQLSWFKENKVQYFITSDKFGYFWFPEDQARRKLASEFNNRFKGLRILKAFGSDNLFLDRYSTNPRVIILGGS